MPYLVAFIIRIDTDSSQLYHQVIEVHITTYHNTTRAPHQSCVKRSISNTVIAVYIGTYTVLRTVRCMVFVFMRSRPSLVAAFMSSIPYSFALAPASVLARAVVRFSLVINKAVHQISCGLEQRSTLVKSLQ